MKNSFINRACGGDKPSISRFYGVVKLYPVFCLAAALVLFSCAASPHARVNTPAETLPARQLPERPVLPPVPELIMGQGLTNAEEMAAFLLGANPEAGKNYADTLAAIYVEEAAGEGVNHDVAFAQMCHETGFLRFGGLVTPDMNNFCGLGSTGPGHRGEVFPDARTGVRAHIQHLKAYATEAPLKNELADPRYRWVRYGSSPSIKGLAGTWAADPNYAVKLKSMLERLYNSSFGTSG